MPTQFLNTAELSSAQREQMFALLAVNFDGLRRDRFDADLAEKPWAFVIADERGGKVNGFSTLMPLEVDVDGRRAIAFFSGDTVLDETHWGDRAFVRCVGQNLMRLAGKRPEGLVYWLLLTCAFRGYRFLPAFFREFYPRAGAESGLRHRRAIDALVRKKFGGEYQADAGVVALDEPTPFHPGRGEIDPRHFGDPHAAFFAEANPGFPRGDFLVCWAELSWENLTPLGQRLTSAVGP